MAKSRTDGVRAGIATAVVVGVGLGAFAADPSGPAFGKNKFTTSIQTVQGQRDVDDFVSALVAGEQLTVKVRAGKGSALRPTISLVDPDGQELAAPALPVAIKKGGKAAQLKKFVIPRTGSWAVRIGGDGTQGAYTVAFAVKGVKPLKIKKQTLGGASPLVNTHRFEGTEGGLLDLTLAFKPKQTAPAFVTLTDPQGDDVPGQLGNLVDEALPKGKKKLLIQDAPLSTGDGSYAVDVGIPAGTASYNLTIAVTPQGRPKAKKALELTSFEPFLELRVGPINGIAGQEVRLSGQGFSGVPIVLFGDLPGIDPTVGGGGAFIDVTVPNGAGMVPVTVINPDKQASARDDYFFYVPPPVITDVVTLAGDSSRGATTEGGTTLRLVGENFVEGSTLLLGSVSALDLRVVDSQRLEFTTQPTTAGDVTVRLSDPFGRSVIPAFDFTFKRPPSFATTPYDPASSPGTGGVLVTVSGDAFDEEDQLIVGGVETDSTFVDVGTRTFLSPVSATSGNFTVSLVDRFGSRVDGPDFVVKAAPTLTGVVPSAGPRMGATHLPLAGGTTVTVSGTNFDAGDTVTFAGATVTASNVTATQFDFIAPASAVGFADLTVTDTLGQSDTLTAPLSYVGFVDATMARLPIGDAVDDFSAVSGALGDLDGDGDRNDLAIVSQTSSPGTRYEHTRILSNTYGALTDDTDANFPAYGTDYYGYDSWEASAAAIGDLGGYYGYEYLVIAGKPTTAYFGTAYDSYSYDVRVFGRTDPTATSKFELQAYYSPQVTYTAYAYDGYYYTTIKLLQPVTPFNDFGTVTSLQLGDLDGDNDLDIVMGADHYRTGYLYVDPLYVTAYDTGSFFYAYYGSAYYYAGGLYYYFPAITILDNGMPAGFPFLDVTVTRLPSVGTFPSTLPAFPTRDLELGDIDGDNDLDIVGTWDDPSTTTPSGLYSGNGSDIARLSTHVLVNDGYGVFTDASSSWMPATGSPEFWQGHQIELADMDGDNDLDVFLLLAESTDAFQGTPSFRNHALRVLRNDSPTSTFTDVTTTVLPAVPLPGTRNDNLRGEALMVKDFNGDGFVDILIGTTATLTEATSTTAIGSTRLLGGSSTGVFTMANGFLPAVTVDTGQAQDYLVGDIAGANRITVTLLSEVKGTSEALRMYDWTR